MTTLLTDGFDKYGPAGLSLPTPRTTLATGKWSAGTFGNIFIDSGLSSTGQCVELDVFFSEITTLSRSLATNYARLIGGFRILTDLQAPMGCTFFDNFTAQCSITVEPISGFIAIKSGANGTILGLSSGSMTANTIHMIEFDITFNTNGALGGWTIWLDGVQVLAGTGVTSLSGNNYTNVFQFSAYGIHNDFSAGVMKVDDLYLFDSTTAFNNAALLANTAVITDFAIGDHSIQFVNEGNVFGNPIVKNQTSNAYSMAANTLYLIPFTPNVNCTINEIFVWINQTSTTAQFKGVIYSDSAGAPNTLLSSGTNVVGCTTGTQLGLPLVTPQNLTAGVQYWLGLINDTTTVFYWFDNSTLHGFRANNTFGSGAPGTAPAMTANQDTLALAGYCTGATTNWESEALNPPVGDASSVAEATVGKTDYYTFPALPASVAQVYTVGVSGNCRLAFSGVHTFDLLALSSGTSGSGSNPGQNPTINYSWYDSYFDTDPHTSAAWTPTNVTNAFFGMDIAS